MPKADIKTKKFFGFYVVNLSEGNFRNPHDAYIISPSAFRL